MASNQLFKVQAASSALRLKRTVTVGVSGVTSAGVPSSYTPSSYAEPSAEVPFYDPNKEPDGSTSIEDKIVLEGPTCIDDEIALNGPTCIDDEISLDGPTCIDDEIVLDGSTCIDDKIVTDCPITCSGDGTKPADTTQANDTVPEATIQVTDEASPGTGHGEPIPTSSEVEADPCPPADAEDTEAILPETVSKKSDGEFSDCDKKIYAQIVDDLYECMPQDRQQADLAYASYWTESMMDNAYALQMRGFRQLKKSPKMADSRPFDIMNNFLKHARRRGFSALGKVYFPDHSERFWEIITYIWIIGELGFLFVGLILSIAAVTSGSTPLYSWFHLALASLGMLLAIVDGVGSFRPCRCCPSKVKDSETLKKVCDKCWLVKTCLNIGRAVLTEFIVTPLLICDLFDIFVGMGYSSDDHIERLGFALFIFDSIALFLFMYVARILIMASAVRSMRNMQPPKADNVSRIKRRAYRFTVFIVIHTSAQLLAHFIMIVSIGAQIAYENDDLSDESPGYYNASAELIFMCILACVIPILGVVSFFVYANFWFQEFPISVIADFIPIIQMPSGKEMIKSTKTVEDCKDNFQKIVNKLATMENVLYGEFNAFCNKGLNVKFLYPFRKPVFVLFCFVYTALQLSFFVCALVGSAHTASPLLLFNILAGIYILIINFYVFVIAAFWFTVITVLTILQLIEILIFLLWCMCVCIQFVEHPVDTTIALAKAS